MKTVLKRMLGALLVSQLFFLNIAYAEPPNLSLLKRDLKEYHDSGNYEREIKAVVNQARQYMMEEVAANNKREHKQHLAIVLDIDETSISNYQQMIARDFTADLQKIHEEILKAKAPAIKPILALYNDALKQGVKIFFITGRNQSERDVTKLNLTRAGYHGWAGLYLRPDDYHQSSIEPFKAKTRALISQKGYVIIETIGDQYSDLLGGYAKKEYKLPNPFYFLN